MGTKEKIKNWLDSEYNSIHLEHVSKQKEVELKDSFIRFYCKFDKRLMRIKREKISVSPIKNAVCAYHWQLGENAMGNFMKCNF